jgi:L-asparagine transporter-like permease
VRADVFEATSFYIELVKIAVIIMLISLLDLLLVHMLFAPNV